METDKKPMVLHAHRLKICQDQAKVVFPIRTKVGQDGDLPEINTGGENSNDINEVQVPGNLTIQQQGDLREVLG